MKNRKHYVPFRMTKSAKERFVKMCKACNVPECTFLFISSWSNDDDDDEED